MPANDATPMTWPRQQALARRTAGSTSIISLADAPYAPDGLHESVMAGAVWAVSPIACGNCHGHGMDDSILGASASGRVTF